MFELTTVSSLREPYGSNSTASNERRANVEIKENRPPSTLVSDQCRALATSLQIRSGASSVIVFAATEIHDSVISLVASLGPALIAVGGGEVLVLNASERVRRPWQSRERGEQAASPESSFEDLVEEMLPGLFTLNAEGEAIARLLRSEKGAKAFFNALRQRFRYVLVAAPPYARDSEARLLAKYSDGIVLTLQQERQGRARLIEIRRELKADGLVSLGFVLSDGSTR
jgi:Mrp family chromosome partitioning ATPase